MNLALNQAMTALGNTKENPAVGCVIVKNDKVISAGSTSANGRPHAEHNAINFSKVNLKNSSIYITLEPCSHYGQTSPCVKKIIKKKIKNVFFSVKDVDKRSFNKSTKLFNISGLITKNGLLKKEINNFYKSYYNFKKNKLPFVTCKLAISKDFFISSIYKKKWITNFFSRGRVHLMRSRHDCLITSSETVIKDNPYLTCRINGLNKRSPARIILDNRMRIPVKSNIFKDTRKYKTILFYNKPNSKKIKLLKKRRVTLIKTAIDLDGQINLKNVLFTLSNLGYSRVFLESGIKLILSFFEKKLINDFQLFISKNKLNKFGRINVDNRLKFFLKKKRKIFQKINLLGDKLVYYKIK